MNDIQKLRYWTFKILPLVYDDSLSYYEVLAKVTSKLNEIVENVNEIPNDITTEISNQLNSTYATNIAASVKEQVDALTTESQNTINSLTTTSQATINNLATSVITGITKAIATDEGTATYTSSAKNGGELIWLNNTLYEVIAPMPAGTNYIVGINLNEVVLSDYLNHMKGYLSDNNEFYAERSSHEYDTGVYLYWKDNLYITTADIKVNDILYDGGDSQNVKEVTLGEEIASHYLEMHNADNNLQTQIDGNDGDIEKLQEQDNNLQSQITQNNTNVNNRISNIVSQSGDDNTEIVDARKWASKFGEVTSTVLGDAIRGQITKSLTNLGEMPAEFDLNDATDTGYYIMSGTARPTNYPSDLNFDNNNKIFISLGYVDNFLLNAQLIIVPVTGIIEYRLFYRNDGTASGDLVMYDWIRLPSFYTWSTTPIMSALSAYTNNIYLTSSVNPEITNTSTLSGYGLMGYINTPLDKNVLGLAITENGIYFKSGENTYLAPLTNGGWIDNGTDINTLPKNGVYTKAYGLTNASNLPSTSFYSGILFEINSSSADSDFRWQFYLEDSTDQLWLRDTAGANADFLASKWNRLTTDPLIRKQYVACGDSFSAGDFNDLTTWPTIQSGEYKGQYTVYPYLIGDQYNMAVTNLSRAGRSIATGNEGNSFQDVYTQIPSNADYITLYFGINDSRQNVTIGEWGNEDVSTFYGAWKTVMDWIINNRPNAKIGIIVSNGPIQQAYIDAEIDIATKYGVPYINMNDPTTHGPVVNMVNSNIDATIIETYNNRYRVSSNNVHPNELCHRQEAIFLGEWLKTL